MRFDELLGDAAGAVRVGSAGVSALVGSPMDESSAAELRRLGGDPTGFVSTQLDGAHVEEADLVLAATRQLRSRVLEESPRALRRTFTIRELAGLLASSGLGGARSRAWLTWSRGLRPRGGRWTSRSTTYPTRSGSRRGSTARSPTCSTSPAPPSREPWRGALVGGVSQT